MPPLDGVARGHAHQALFYCDEAEYLDGIAAFLGPGIAAGDAAAVAVPGGKHGLVRERLGESAEVTELLDMEELGENPARIISAVQGMIDRHADRRLHYVGEPIWPGRTPAEIREATRHEWLVNLAWPRGEVRVLCPYDATRLDAAVMADAECTHPAVVRGGRAEASGAYQPASAPAGCDEPLGPPPSGARALPFAAQDLGHLREVVDECAVAAGLDRARSEALVLAVNELTTNTVRHARTPGVLRLWTEGTSLVCQVEDGGHIADPLAGRRRAPAGRGGLGLWMVNQLCDLVEVRTGPGATTIRVRASAGSA